MPFDLRADREALADRAQAALEPHVEVVVRGTVASVEDGVELGRRLRASEVEAVLVLQTLAVMPAYTSAALAEVPQLPAVIWTVHREPRIPPDFDHAGITSEGATVGTPMLTNVLVRSGRPFRLVVGLVDDVGTLETVAEALRRGAAATRLRRSRIGRVGPVFQGYDCVDADDDRLRAATGIEPVPIDAAELRELYLAVTPGRVAELERETREVYDVDPGAEGDTMERSLRAACALDDLVERHRLDARRDQLPRPEHPLRRGVGIAPCFALGSADLAGHPVGMRGRRRHAVAMLTLKLLGGAAQYHELESLDYGTRRARHRELGRARPRVRRRAAAPGPQPLVRRGSPLRRLRLLRRTRRPGDAGRVHRARRADARISLHRCSRRIHRHGLAAGRDAVRGLPLRERPVDRGLEALVPRRARTTIRPRLRATSPTRSRTSHGSSASSAVRV